MDERLQSVFENETVAVTIVSFEEQMRGWMAYLNKASSKKDERALIDGYDRLHELLKDFEIRTVLDFDEAAFDLYRDLKNLNLRVGTMDLRIAAIALSNNATLLTRNLRDFAKIPKLKFEDWTKD